MPTSAKGRCDDSRAHLLLPQTSLCGLLFAGVVRDLRGENLRPDEHFNCLPALPLCSVTWIYEGELHLVNDDGQIDPTPLPQIFVAGPYRRPLFSWSAAPFFSMTIGFYADAWTILTGVDAGGLIDQREPLERVSLGELSQVFRAVLECGSSEDGFSYLQDRLDPLWQEVRPEGNALAPQRLEDWTRDLAARAAFSGPEISERQIQRRIKSWTGQTLRELRFHARAESLFALSHTAPSEVDLAKVAAEAGYSDQSHMGRAIRRITGESPAKINRLIHSDERYWIYRLLGQRL